MKNLILLLLVLGSFWTAQAQETEMWLRGRVVDAETEEALIGALLQQGKNGVTTDIEGRFVLKISDKSLPLKISMLGYKAQEFSPANLVSTSQPLRIALETDAEMLEEVVVGFQRENVYSRRRNEDPQDVPEALTVFSSEEIQEAQLQNTQDVIDATPGVSMANSQNPANVFVTVRGIRQVRFGEAPITTVIDGVTLPSSYSINTDLYDIESIEFIKGPQGALYGRNAIAGALSITTKKPTNELEGFARLGAGNGGTYESALALSGPILKDKLLFRVSGSLKNRDGLIENEFNGELVDNLREGSFRAQLLASLGSRVMLDAKFSYLNAEAGGLYWVAHEDGTANDFSNGPEQDLLGNNSRELLDASLKAEVDFGRFGTLESITAFSGVTDELRGDQDNSSASVFAQYQNFETRGISEEIRLTSPNNQKFRWLLGAYALGFQQDVRSGLEIDLESALAIIIGLPQGEGFFPLFENDVTNSNTTLAGFGQINYNPIEDLEITAALRYDVDERRQRDNNPNVDIPEKTETFSQLQPKISLSYRFSDKVMAYSTFATGFRSGGFNPPGESFFPEIYNAEVSQNIELGVKTNFWKNRVVFNLAAYQINVQDQQIFLIDLSTPEVQAGILNIDQTRILGAEAEVKFRPHENLDLIGSFSYTDGEIIEYVADESAEGNVSPFTHRTLINGAATYRFKVSDDFRIIPRVDVQQRGAMYWHINNADKQEAYTLTHFSLGFHYKTWSLTGYVRNAFDTQYAVEYYAQEYSGGTSDVRWPNPPRMFGARVEYRF